jgi:small-conductance mechanosensitive channel
MLAAFYNKGRFVVGDELTVEGQRGEVINMDTTTLTLRMSEGELIVPLSKLSDNQYIIHRRTRFMPLKENEETED